MFARYCAVVAVQGVGVWAPKSSFSAIHGVWQPVTETAKSKSRSARVLDQRRIGGHRRRADAVVEVEVEEDGRGPVLARFRRLDGAGGERKRQPGLLRQRRVVAGEVDPERVRVGDPALARERAPGGDQREQTAAIRTARRTP